MCKQCNCDVCKTQVGFFERVNCIPEPKPHVHADCIKAWADGATIEFFNSALGEWRIAPSPRWVAHTKYRVKPKEKVKKWKYVIRYDRTNRLEVSGNYYSSGDEANDKLYYYTAVEKIEATMKEFDSD